MTRQELEHIIRAAADVTRQDNLIVIGSQAILGEHPNAPEALLVSMEADIYAPAAPELSDDIDGALGRDSLFDKTHGYHADGVSPSTASLPAGWNERLIPICNANTNGATGWCIETHDIAIAKYAAGRDKDLRYTSDLWENALLDPRTLEERLRDTRLKATDKPRGWIESTIRRQRALHETRRSSLERGVGPQRNDAGRGSRKDGAGGPLDRSGEATQDRAKTEVQAPRSAQTPDRQSPAEQTPAPGRREESD